MRQWWWWEEDDGNHSLGTGIKWIMRRGRGDLFFSHLSATTGSAGIKDGAPAPPTGAGSVISA